MASLEKRSIQSLKKWYEKHKGKAYKVKSVSHVHARAYVISKAASACLVVAYPIDDAEPQIKAMRDFMGSDGVVFTHTFDDTLKMGDWCTIGYVVSEGIQESIAIPMVK